MSTPSTITVVEGPPRVGIAFTPFETRADVMLRIAMRADNLGLDHVGFAEGWTHDSMIALAELATRTSSIGLGTLVISAWGRTPATIASARPPCSGAPQADSRSGSALAARR
jgi:alkanesulfonate monooxygenase SsuD/methylene tetrahydromethanopterin reductase-like flavin-dependent oxidoreductase (luciferase family)